MSSVAQYQWLNDGKRLHLQHGPIDLIVEARGESDQVARAYQQAHEVFQNILHDLVSELDLLRTPVSDGSVSPAGCVAGRMYKAASPYCKRGSYGLVTPMVAVAGSVADHVLQAMSSAASLSQAYVNNGGDIALWLNNGERFTVGICDNTETGHIGSRVNLQGTGAAIGVATSGWRGRSFSLGIADAVTVLASSAATADAAATIIANAVNVSNCDGIHRQPAFELSPDSDLGGRLVTVSVDKLSLQDVQMALDNGKQVAQELIDGDLIEAAYMSLQGINTVCLRQTLCAGAMYA